MGSSLFASGKITFIVLFIYLCLFCSVLRNLICSGWVEFTNKCKHIKRKARRIFQNPHFGMWCQYTEWSKYMKCINKACSKIQSLYRMSWTKWRYKFKRLALNKIRRFIKAFRCFVFVLKKRSALFELNYLVWKPDEIVRRAASANQRERDRLTRMLTLLRDNESKTSLQLKKHLRTSDGKFQIQEMVERVKIQYAKVSLAYDFCQKDLLRRCIEANNSLVKHGKVH